MTTRKKTAAADSDKDYRDQMLDVLYGVSGQRNAIPVPTLFIKMFDDLEVAAFLNQCLYWQGRCSRRDGWWWHSNREWQNELALGRRAVERCRKPLEHDPVTGRPAIVWSAIGMAMGSPTYFYKVNGAVLVEEARKLREKIRALAHVENNPFPENALLCFDPVEIPQADTPPIIPAGPAGVRRPRRDPSLAGEPDGLQ